MASCVAYGCTSRFTKKIPGITFHRFPKDEKRRALWVKAVRRINWVPSKDSKLCSKHFHEDQIDRTSLSCVRLRENAVPVIFEAFPSYLQMDTKPPRKLPKSRSVSSQPANIIPVDVPAFTDVPASSTFISSTSMSSPSTSTVPAFTNVPPSSALVSSTSISPPSISTVPADVPAFTDVPPSSTLVSNASMSPPSTSTLSSVHLSTISSPVTASPTKADLKRKVDSLTEVIEKKNKKIKLLQQKARRYKKRVTNNLYIPAMMFLRYVRLVKLLSAS